MAGHAPHEGYDAPLGGHVNMAKLTSEPNCGLSTTLFCKVKSVEALFFFSNSSGSQEFALIGINAGMSRLSMI